METPNTDAALESVIAAGGTLGPEHEPLVNLARELEDKAGLYWTALDLVRKWDQWNPEQPLPEDWPTRNDDSAAPLSPADIVYAALSA